MSAASELLELYRHLSPARRRQLLVISFLTPITAAAEMMTIAALVPFLDLVSPGAGSKSMLGGMLDWLVRSVDLTGIAAAAALFVAAAFMVAVLRLVLAWASLRFTADLGHELNLEIQRRMFHQPYLFHVLTHSSRLIASLDKVEELVFGFLLNGINAVSASIISVALIVALLLVDARSAAGAVALIGVLYGAALLLVRANLARHSKFVATAHQQRIRQTQENAAGIRDIILDHSQDAHLRQFGELDARFMRSRTEISFLSSAPRFLVEGVGLGLVALIALVLASRPGGIPAALPTLGALALGAIRLLPLASQIYGGWVTAVAARPLVGEVVALLELPIPRESGRPTPLPFSRAIAVENVGFHYPGRSEPALRNIGLTIPSRSRIAIVGRNGSGKSTLADLLMGMLEPTEGQIRVDGQLLVGGALASWRRSVAHVPQSIFVADTTIARNIAIGTPDLSVDMDRVRRAAKAAHLDDWVSSLPLGYDTQAGERGAKLSGGQRQKLALARAVYKQAPLLVLDEATSALDKEAEASFLGALDDFQADGCTIIIIAHRLSTVEQCDCIFMLDQGRLVQSGTFTELFGRLNRLQEEGEL